MIRKISGFDQFNGLKAHLGLGFILSLHSITVRSAAPHTVGSRDAKTQSFKAIRCFNYLVFSLKLCKPEAPQSCCALLS